jgi:putative membrane protein
MKLLLKWVLSAISLMVIARFLNGFDVQGFVPALIAAAVIGLVNATLGTLVKILTFPITIITFGLFLIVINAAMLKIAAAFVPGFTIHGWLPAIIAAILLSLVSSLLHWLVGDSRRERRDY